MAKKKTESNEAKSGGKKKQSAKPAGGAAGGMPMIDTSAAAAAAARMLASGVQLPAAGTAESGGKTESALFKQLKAGQQAKPGSAGVGGALGQMPGVKKPNQSHHPDKQKGHNQTFGADSSRTYVPRRTSG